VHDVATPVQCNPPPTMMPPPSPPLLLLLLLELELELPLSIAASGAAGGGEGFGIDEASYSMIPPSGPNAGSGGSPPPDWRLHAKTRHTSGTRHGIRARRATGKKSIVSDDIPVSFADVRRVGVIRSFSHGAAREERNPAWGRLPHREAQSGLEAAAR
jgi:hypothetical protein